MTERKRIFLLILIMAVVGIVASGVAITMLYRAALEEQHARLLDTARSRARFIEAVARFNAIHTQDYPGGPAMATLSQIVDAHNNFEGFGETGEFVLARRDGGQIVFLLSHRHHDLATPEPVPYDSPLAEPMRRALSGSSGSMVGPDYKGEMVLAAYEPVDFLDLGTVTKIDLKEIRAPFLKASMIAMGAGLLAILVGVLFFLRISDPILRRLRVHSENLEKLVGERTVELALANESLRKAQEVAHIGSWHLNLLENILEWSDESYRIFGVPIGAPSNYEKFLEIVHPDDRGYVDKKWKAAIEGEPYDIEHRILVNNEVKWVREKAELKFDDKGMAIAGVGVTQDITTQKLAEEALKMAHGELEKRVEVLSGLIPICARCKKIRDDKGYWSQVEEYIRKHTEADFTHCICPDCFEKALEEL
ncbi:MAG: PAS domain-containing protein [Deltaproteobacteria bacterium]|nr:PAS domain-containing protein [Deltaproteobacteria bacterium]